MLKINTIHHMAYVFLLTGCCYFVNTTYLKKSLEAGIITKKVN